VCLLLQYLLQYWVNLKCVFITAVPITKSQVFFFTAVPITQLFAGGGGGEQWRTCTTRDYEPRPVWTSLPITHLGIEPKTPGWLVQDPTTSPSGDLIPTIRGSGGHPGLVPASRFPPSSKNDTNLALQSGTNTSLVCSCPGPSAARGE
jgi:hypothetical protein